MGKERTAAAIIARERSVQNLLVTGIDDILDKKNRQSRKEIMELVSETLTSMNIAYMSFSNEQED